MACTGLGWVLLGWNGKKSLCVRERRFPNTALALGWRLALITCVCASFWRVTQHDSVRNQEQPLKHSTAFSLQCYRGWGGKGVFHCGFGEHFRRDLPFAQQPFAAWSISSALGGSGDTPPPPPPRAAIAVNAAPSASRRKGLVISVSVIFLLFLLSLLQDPGYPFAEKVIKQRTCAEWWVSG